MYLYFSDLIPEPNFCRLLFFKNGRKILFKDFRSICLVLICSAFTCSTIHLAWPSVFKNLVWNIKMFYFLKIVCYPTQWSIDTSQQTRTRTALYIFLLFQTICYLNKRRCVQRKVSRINRKGLSLYDKVQILSSVCRTKGAIIKKRTWESYLAF